MRLRNVLPAVAPIAAVALAGLVALSGFGTGPTTRPPASCAVIYRITDEWSGGFSSAVTLINTSDAPIQGWELEWAFPNGQTPVEVWDGVATTRGDSVTIRNTADNAVVAPAGTTVVRFTGPAGSRNEQPHEFRVNGRTCTLA